MFDDPILAVDLGSASEGATVIENKFKVSRKAHVCLICAGAIAPGERVRTESRRGADNVIVTVRVCRACAGDLARQVAA